MRSLVYVHDERYRRLLLSYSKLLRTDLDVFLTPSFFTWRPTRFVTGRGAYSTMRYTQDRLVGIAEKLGLRHRRAFCVGSTWFGDSKVRLGNGCHSAVLTDRSADRDRVDESDGARGAALPG